jgi:hypothetical protein
MLTWNLSPFYIDFTGFASGAAPPKTAAEYLRY